MKREIVISNEIFPDGFNKMYLRIHDIDTWLDFRLTPNEISIQIKIDGYNNFYEIIRGLNHEEFHFILLKLFDVDICKKLDKLVHNSKSNSMYKNELYELPSKATKQTSIKDLTDSISALNADDLHFKKFGYHLDLKKFR